MHRKLFTIAAILALTAVSLTMLTMTVMAGSGNPVGLKACTPTTPARTTRPTRSWASPVQPDRITSTLEKEMTFPTTFITPPTTGTTAMKTRILHRLCGWSRSPAAWPMTTTKT